VRGSSELVASGHHVRFAAFLSGSSRHNRSSASTRTEACLHQDHTFRCRPCQATSVLHEQFAVPLDFVRGFLLNDLRRPSRAAPLFSPCGSGPSRRAAASRALSSAPASSSTASSTPPHTCACAFQHRELRAQARTDRSTSRRRSRILTRTPVRHCLACRATAPPLPAVGHAFAPVLPRRRSLRAVQPPQAPCSAPVPAPHQSSTPALLRLLPALARLHAHEPRAPVWDRSLAPRTAAPRSPPAPAARLHRTSPLRALRIRLPRALAHRSAQAAAACRSWAPMRRAPPWLGARRVRSPAPRLGPQLAPPASVRPPVPAH
jgi:hypothetical protein